MSRPHLLPTKKKKKEQEESGLTPWANKREEPLTSRNCDKANAALRRKSTTSNKQGQRMKDPRPCARFWWGSVKRTWSSLKVMVLKSVKGSRSWLARSWLTDRTKRSFYDSMLILCPVMSCPQYYCTYYCTAMQCNAMHLLSSQSHNSVKEKRETKTNQNKKNQHPVPPGTTRYPAIECSKKEVDLEQKKKNKGIVPIAVVICISDHAVYLY